MTDDEVGEVGQGLGAIASACLAIINRLAGVVAILCTVGACVAIPQMEKSGSITDPNALTLIGLLVLGFLASYVWFETQDNYN